MVVTALLLVGLFAASVLAQASNPPEVETQIEDQTLTITATSVDVTVNLADVDGNGNAAFIDVVDDQNTPDPIVFTAMTTDPAIATVGLGDDDGTMVVQNWWNALDGTDDDSCTKKSQRLGFSLLVNTLDTDDPDRPDNAPAILDDDQTVRR